MLKKKGTETPVEIRDHQKEGRLTQVDLALGKGEGGNKVYRQSLVGKDNYLSNIENLES